MICLGRAGVDLYALEPNLDFKDVLHFRKSVGGSPANIAVALSTLGLNVGFIGKVSGDPFGQYVKSFLEEKGVDTEGLLIYLGGFFLSFLFDGYMSMLQKAKKEYKGIDMNILFS